MSRSVPARCGLSVGQFLVETIITNLALRVPNGPMALEQNLALCFFILHVYLYPREPLNQVDREYNLQRAW